MDQKTIQKLFWKKIVTLGRPLEQLFSKFFFEF